MSSAISGYAGGHVERPTYEEVCDKKTGHAEVVAVYYDPKIVSYETILEVFFALHGPTTLNQQKNDVGDRATSSGRLGCVFTPFHHHHRLAAAPAPPASPAPRQTPAPPSPRAPPASAASPRSLAFAAPPR